MKRIWIALGVKQMLKVTAIHNGGPPDDPLSDPGYDSENLACMCTLNLKQPSSVITEESMKL